MEVTSLTVWILVRKTPAYALHAAWWGKDIILGTVWPPSDSMNDDPVSLHDTVVIDQSVHAEALGEILLREEYKITLDVLMSWASRSPRNGLAVTGQPGIGDRVPQNLPFTMSPVKNT